MFWMRNKENNFSFLAAVQYTVYNYSLSARLYPCFLTQLIDCRCTDSWSVRLHDTNNKAARTKSCHLYNLRFEDLHLDDNSSNKYFSGVKWTCTQMSLLGISMTYLFYFKTDDCFSGARYLLINIMAILDHHSNIIAAALGLET